MTSVRELPAEFGPEYNIASAELTKHRRAARKGLASWDKAERHAYGAAVEAAVLAAQRSSLRRETQQAKAQCASGTFHSTGEAIHEAIKRQQRAALARIAARDRNKTPEQWKAQYEQAMKEKRERTQ